MNSDWLDADLDIVRFPWLKGAMDSLSETPTWLRREAVLAVIRCYTAEVNCRAEANMLKTGKLEGSHYAAMRQVNKELGI